MSAPATQNKSYTLCYFNKYGKSELCKLILEYSQAKFTDNFIQNLTDSDTQFGVGPYLDVKTPTCECKIPLVSCICRYLAREFGLAGKCNEDQGKADAISTQCMMLIDHYYNNVFNVENTDQKKIGLKSYKEKECEDVCGEIEGLIKMWHSHETGHCVGNYITYADLFVYEVCANYIPKDTPFSNRYPHMFRISKFVENDPKLTKFFSNRKLSCERPDLLNLYWKIHSLNLNAKAWKCNDTYLQL